MKYVLDPKLRFFQNFVVNMVAKIVFDLHHLK